MAIIVKRMRTAVNESNCYLCWESAGRDAVIVDPSEIRLEMRATIEEEALNIRGILITHGHYDHVQALAETLALWPVTVYAGEYNQGGQVVEHGQRLEIGSLRFLVVETAGHTDDSLSFLTEGHAFVGDALFAAAVGGTTGRAPFLRQRNAIRAHLLTLPDDTILHPGHGPATTVAVERCYNPFL